MSTHLDPTNAQEVLRATEIPGEYQVTLPDPIDLDRATHLFRRLAELRGNRVQVTRAGRTVWFTVTPQPGGAS